MKLRIKYGLPSLFFLMMATSCTMMHQDLDDCPVGLYLTFQYDYNLERADMFNDHVGSVTVYVYDTNGHYLTKQEEANTASYLPLQSTDYRMHMDLPAGRYQLLVVANDKSYEETLLEGANFVRNEPQEGDAVEDFCLLLDRMQEGTRYRVDHKGTPLDDLWMGRLLEEDGTTMKVVDVYDTKPTYDTVSLVRDTKRINVTLRELQEPELMDIANFDMRIYDRNSHILWDNSLNERDTVYYTPYATWNTEDRETSAEGRTTTATGRMAHAEFMTSRIIYHERAEDDAVLSVVNKESGVEVIRINLADVLSRLASSETDYSPQEFLDRGYEYQLSFFLQGDRWVYAQLSISTLSWSVRIQNTEL